MSEFKYACPVCGQHIKCDSVQSGSVMECPTCFQKITVPQAPADANQKFILSGKKVEERPVTRMLAAAQSPAPAVEPARRSFPVAALALLVLIVGTATAAVIFRGTFFKSGGDQPAPAPPNQPQAAAKPTPPPAPPVVVPKASDTNWLLDLSTADYPDTPVAGRIHGEDFLAERAFLQSGTLTLRMGSKGSVEFGVVINFSGAQADALAGKTINITTNAPLAARVTLRWKEGDQSLKDNFETGYALHLTFGEVTTNHLPGKIYFCAPDDARSYVAGTFNAEIRKPKASKPKAAAPQP